MDNVRSIVREIIAHYKSPRYQGEEGPFARFRARDLEYGREVLVNVLPKIVGDSPAGREYFARLTRAVTRLDHPRIAGVLRMGQEKGIPYLVTTAVQEARSLASQLTQEPMDLEKAGALIAKIGAALEYAAAQDVAHGSLTPEHILFDRRGETLVTGFGLAALAALAGARKEDINNPYLPPEQRLADHAPTTRGDVYSLGAILYRLIIGRAPDPDPDRIAPADAVNPAVSPAIAQALHTSLAYEPAERYQSADNFVLALRSAIHAPRAAPAPLGRNDLRPAIAPDDMPAFPEPLDIEQPSLDILRDVSLVAQRTLSEIVSSVSMPAPLPIPEIDWEEWLAMGLAPDEPHHTLP